MLYQFIDEAMSLIYIYGGAIVDYEKEVYFSEYCERCAYFKNGENEDPCDDCLNHPYNDDSHKPVRWEAKE